VHPSTVTIKNFPAAFGSDQQRLQRFIRGAQTASALNHSADRHDQLPIYDTLTVDDPEWVDEYLIYEGIEDQIL